MYNPSPVRSRVPNIRVAVGNNGRMQAAALIAQGRARRIGVGAAMPNYACPPNGTSIPKTCAPVAQVCPENQKRVTMPFVPDAGYTVTVLAGAEVRFVGRPQYLFKPDRLIIGSEITPFFDVVNFIIGNKPQSLAQGSVAASMYSEVATYVDMSFDQCYPGIDVILVARNKSAVTQTFQAQLVGWADMA